MKKSKGLLLGIYSLVLIGMWEATNHSWWVLVVAGLLVMAYSSYSAQASRLELRRKLREPVAGPFVDEAAGAELLPEDDIHLCRNFMNSHDWDAARQVLQRIAYGIHSESDETKQEFKKLMTEFAAKDPLVSSVSRTVLALVREKPGVLQTQIYKHLPGIGVEEARYALYFMEQLQLIDRRKSGSSYKLFEIGPVIDA